MCLCVIKWVKLEKVFILIKLLRLIFMFRLIFIIIFIFIFIRYLLSYSYLWAITSYICPTTIYICLTAIYICPTAIYICPTAIYICPTAIYICPTANPQSAQSALHQDRRFYPTSAHAPDPLPAHTEEFIADADDGIVVITYGSMRSLRLVLPYIMERMLEAFGKKNRRFCLLTMKTR